jgi:tripartite-type tricarboxylate transporter receptor subunit TctC
VRTAIQKSAGLDAIAMDPDAFAGHIRKEAAVWGELIKRVNIQLK